MSFSISIKANLAAFLTSAGLALGHKAIAEAEPLATDPEAFKEGKIKYNKAHALLGGSAFLLNAATETIPTKTVASAGGPKPKAQSSNTMQA